MQSGRPGRSVQLDIRYRDVKRHTVRQVAELGSHDVPIHTVPLFDDELSAL